MRDKPLIVSLLVGLVAILIIALVSFLVRINSLDEIHQAELEEKISLQQELEILRRRNKVLGEENASLQEALKECKVEVKVLSSKNLRLKKLKEELEESLTEKLMERELYNR